MYSQIFQEIGLTPNEAKIYETLLNEGALNVSSVSLNSGIHRRNAYDAIDRLVEKGLIFPVLSKEENTYKAASPSKLLEIIRAKENKLSAILPALEEQYHKNPRKQEIFVYRGLEGVKNYLRDILKTGADLYTIGSAGFLFNEKIKSFVNSFHLEAEAIGLKEKHILNSIQKDIFFEGSKISADSCKFLPEGKASDMSINIFGDHIVSVVEGENEKDLALYVIIDNNLAKGYQQIFDILWATLP
ncbi:hypothetical protein GYA54_01395 [Candidatus Kuenenbacteria bacterium]|nr:hypothetical protein [Candidatus Kuenenbacteria bacterium]